MLDEVNEALTTHLAGWTPADAGDMIRFYETELPGMLEHFGHTLGTLGDKTSEDLPLDPIMGEYIHDLAGTAHTMADVARAAAAAFRNAHEAEINRIENPRHAEHVWDATG
jgi:hypothetical protein